MAENASLSSGGGESGAAGGFRLQGLGGRVYYVLLLGR